MLISELINNGSQILKKNNIFSHLLDSELIISCILNKSREKLLTTSDQEVNEQNIVKFNYFIKRRLKREPMAYIFQEKEFWNKKFLVNNGTLIPRPETELLVEKISKYYKNKDLFFLDVGTGSGCILLTLLEEIKNSYGIGIDISKQALDIALKNSKRFELISRSKFLNRSVDQIFGYKFDLIVSNPPYICRHQIKNLSADVKNFEPRIALDGGNDGLDVIKKVIYKSKNILKKKGMLALEIGHGQYKKVSQILRMQGFKDKFLIRDYQNNIRCILTVLKD
jgi:release factor glutamine methyltransferase